MKNSRSKKGNLNSFLRDARIAAGLSQKDVSDRLGYNSAQFVSNWERGLATPPGRTLRKLSQLYKIKADELYEILLEETLARVESELEKEFFG
jgi:transcriptional regulator with XRE-family HTH domain